MRPTRAVVDEALAIVEGLRRDPSDHTDWSRVESAGFVLVDEVRALRRDVEQQVRPTAEAVDGALELDSLKYETVLDAYNVLRAEVMALREELAAMTNDFHDADQAAIARSQDIDLLREMDRKWQIHVHKLENRLGRGESGNVDALVKAARAIGPSGCDADAFVALIEALKPFEEP